ncbi:MAG: FG-GAP-like repeat-containing protein [Pyrinomonadaceae bacterium]
MKNRNLLSIIKQNWKTAVILAVFAAWVSVGIVTSRVSAAAGVPLIVRDAVLTAPSGLVNPHGAAQWQLYSDGNRELEVEIEDVSLAQGTSLTAVIDGNNVGPVILDDRGKGRLKLRTEDGQAVPTVNAGSTVQVRNGSTILAAGAFGGAGATPTPTGSPTGTPSPSPTGSPTGTPSPSPSVSPSPSPTSTPGSTILLVRDAVLASPSGSPNPHGAAQWQLYTNGNRELEVELEDTNLAQGVSLTAFIDGTSVGSLIVDDRGKAKLKLKTELGQVVPMVNAGAAIQVRNSSTVLAAGTFNAGGTPTPTVTPTGTPTPSPTGSPSPSPSPSPENGDLCAALTGATLNGALPTGYASYENHSSRTELEVRIRQVNLPIGTVLAVSVDGFATGNITLQSGGEGRLRLRSDDGQIVPVVAAASTITVKNADVLVLSGVFGGFGTPTPSPSPTGTPGPTPSPTPALGRSFEAHLTGAQVTPPVTTTGNGEIKVTLNAAETQATVFGEFHNLTTNQTGARIETTVGTVTTVRDLGVVGGRNGNFASATFDVTAAQVQQLRSGLWSAVITSVDNPNGEIRGRLTQRSNVSDFNGDGLNDFAFFRPLSSGWHVSNEDGTSTQTFGSPADQPVSGDYDGDGKTDAAVFSKVGTRAFWYINRSSDGGVTTARLGYDTDLPVQADFDGDGRLDMAVFRPTFRTWLILRSDGTGQQVIRLGVPGDKPMPADVDGDGRDDAIVFTPSEGAWNWVRSSDNRRGFLRWGLSTDIPVRGDFDGDGKADISLYRPSEGTWYSVRSSDGQIQATQFGQADDIPVAGKYDADGKTDIAVFRPSEGTWYVLKSTDGMVRTIQFGTFGDIPLTVR